MSVDWVHPGLVLIVGAWLVPLLKGQAKRAVMIAVPAIALVDCVLLQPGTYGVMRFMGPPFLCRRFASCSEPGHVLQARRAASLGSP